MHARIPTRLQNRRAFTLIELTIVVIIMAILAVSLAVAYQNIQLKVRFDANVNEIKSTFQKARSLSLSKMLINGTDPVYYYQVTVDDGYVTLLAYGTTTLIMEELYSFEYDDDMNITTDAIEVYYFPPNGEVCLNTVSCLGDTELSVDFGDDSGTYSAQFSITTVGGYVDVTQTAP